MADMEVTVVCRFMDGHQPTEEEWARVVETELEGLVLDVVEEEVW